MSSAEVAAVVANIKENNEAYFDPEVSDYINRTAPEEGGDDDDADGDGGTVGPEYIKALAIVVKLGSASISLIQRKCAVGYNHAGKIIEWMELMGYISPSTARRRRAPCCSPRKNLRASTEISADFHANTDAQQNIRAHFARVR